MANTESTYADRLARGQLMQTTVAGFAVPFAPADTSLASATFETFLESVEDANDLVNCHELQPDPYSAARYSWRNYANM